MPRKLSVADLVPGIQKIRVQIKRDDGDAYVDIEIAPPETAEDLFEALKIARGEDGLFNVLSRLAGIGLKESVYLFHAAENKDEIRDAVFAVLGITGDSDPTTEPSTA